MSEANAAATSHLRILQHQRRRPAPTVIEVSATYGIDRGERFQCGQVCGPSHSTDMGTPREALERATVTVDEAALILGIPERLRTNPCDAVRSQLDASADASLCCATNSYAFSTHLRHRTSSINPNTARMRNFYATVLPMATGADRYFERRAAEPGFADAYDAARRKIDQIDRLVRALDDRRETLGMSKAELARRADLTPEVVRRLFSADSPNPTIGTLTALADSLGLELVPQKQHAS